MISISEDTSDTTREVGVVTLLSLGVRSGGVSSWGRVVGREGIGWFMRFWGTRVGGGAWTDV